MTCIIGTAEEHALSLLWAMAASLYCYWTQLSVYVIYSDLPLWLAGAASCWGWGPLANVGVYLLSKPDTQQNESVDFNKTQINSRTTTSWGQGQEQAIVKGRTQNCHIFKSV